jgi:hypothetical protein
MINVRCPSLKDILAVVSSFIILVEEMTKRIDALEKTLKQMEAAAGEEEK